MKALKNKLSNKTLTALLIAVTGVSASLASAQFRVEHSAKSGLAHEHDEQAEQSVVVIKSQDDEHAYEIRIVDGEITVARLDGEDFDKEQVMLDGETLVFLDENGETLYTVKMPKIHQPGKLQRGKHLWVTTDDDGLVNTSEREFVVSLGEMHDEEKDGAFIAKGQFFGPSKVMLGINLGEPSTALRKHLKLKDGVQAILVEKVIEGLPADLAGLEDYDVIVSIDGSDQASGQILSKVLAEKDPGDTMKLMVLRSGEKLELKVELAEYNPQALGTILASPSMIVKPQNEKDRILDVLVELENADLGEDLEKKLVQIQEQIRQQFFESREQRELARQMQAKAVDAMRDAERQLIEFRDGKLIVRSGGGMQSPLQVLRGNIRDHVENIAPDGVHGHMDSLEERLEELEGRLDRQIDELSEQMDRLAEMFERLMDALEDDET